MYSSSNDEKHIIWNPLDNLASEGNQYINYAVLVLNTELNFHPDFLVNLWTQAKVRITVDGGTERWLTWLKAHNISTHKVAPPDLITGDMDSLSKEALYQILSTGDCRVIRTPDQHETDFTKALRELSKYCISQNLQVDVVYAVVETSGRFDQIVANISTLCKAVNLFPEMKVFQVASNSLTWILHEGTQIINIPQTLRENRDWCALIPISSTNCVTTSGLKWNLDKARLEMGKLISTSNTYDELPIVTVHTNDKIIWSMGIESLISGNK